jgi:hypothetical protein
VRRSILAAGVALALAATSCDLPPPEPHPTGSPSPTASSATRPPPTPPTEPPSSPPTSDPVTPSPDPDAWPTPATTGAPTETGLAAGPCSLAAGQVYEDLAFDCPRLEVRAGTVIRRSVIRGEVKGDPDGAPFVVEDSSIIGDGCQGAAAVGNSRFVLRRVHIRGFNDGVRAEGPDVQVYDSLIEVCYSAGGHADGLQVCPRSAGCGGEQDVSGLVFHHNRVSHPRADSTAAIFIMGGSAGGRVTDNLMGGFSITLRVHGSGYTVTGNRVVDGSWLYGPVDCDGASSLTWSDNRLVTVDGDGYRVTGLGAELRC